MKKAFALVLAMMLAGVGKAQVETLPPDFVLFGKTNGQYVADYFQYSLPLSTNFDYLLPNAGPLGDDPVYFLQQTLLGTPAAGIQTYFVPDNVYLGVPVVLAWADNLDITPLPIEEWRNLLNSFFDTVLALHVTLDGIEVPNLPAYRTESPVFSVFLPSSDNIYTILLGHPVEGLVDPVVAAGYLLMLKPLPAGLHDFRTSVTFDEPFSVFSFEHHFQVHSLTLPQFLARETDKLIASVTHSSLAPRRQQPLLASLNAALASFDSDNLRTGINQLQAFQNKVRAQIERGHPTLAGQLMNAVRQMIDKAASKLNRTQRP
jgi:hypothetical protein